MSVFSPILARSDLVGVDDDGSVCVRHTRDLARGFMEHLLHNCELEFDTDIRYEIEDELTNFIDRFVDVAIEEISESLRAERGDLEERLAELEDQVEDLERDKEDRDERLLELRNTLSSTVETIQGLEKEMLDATLESGKVKK